MVVMIYITSKYMSKPINPGTTINYNIYGNGEVTLFFIHGSYIDQTYWDAQVKYFEPYYRVVTMDLAGHGKSGHERENWTVRGLADDVAALVKFLNYDNVILIGHSLGGDLALMAVTNYPDPFIGIIGVDTFKNAGTPLAEEYREKAAEILENLKEHFADTNEQYARMVLVSETTPPEITGRVIHDYRGAYQPLGQETTPEIFELYKTEAELLPKLALKLYVINVNNIPTNAEALKQHAVNGFELIEIEGTSHYPMLENPDALNAALEKAVGEIAQQVIE